jgi:Uma2 family endonuclease
MEIKFGLAYMTAYSTPPSLTIPPLENGDRLAQPEFARRYQAMLRGVKAELVEGLVYMASPLRFAAHAEPHAQLIVWLGNYQIATPGVRLGIEPTLRLDLDNELQPDAVLLLDPASGGRGRFTDESYLQGAPELIAEIADSSSAYDLHDKRQAYRRNGVQEYLIWQVLKQRLDWFYLQAGEYIALDADAQGILRSQVFPGLWLDRPAVLQGNMAQVVAVLSQGVTTPGYAAFTQSSRR